MHHRTRNQARRAWTWVVVLAVLGDYAYGSRRSRRTFDETRGIDAIDSSQVGRLVSVFLRAYPPESDPDHEGAHCGGPDDSARDLRNGLISRLGDQKTWQAVEALRALEREFGAKYSWLRRPRARAERAFRLACWSPIPPQKVADLLKASEKRLIRSSQDALDGIVAGVKRYEDKLRHGSSNDLEDFWNRHKKALPTPKEEERVSDRICDAIRQYFAHYAVVAEREVQLFRRKLPKAVGGAPGSEVDVLWQSPAIGTLAGDAIAVPIEVKLSHNPEARAALKDQLADRYMRERGADAAVFVVAWLGKNVRQAYRPVWPDVTAAQDELDAQARKVMAELDGADVRAVVIDLSLPLARKPAQSKKRTGKKKRSPPAKRRGAKRPKRKR